MRRPSSIRCSPRVRIVHIAGHGVPGGQHHGAGSCCRTHVLGPSEIKSMARCPSSVREMLLSGGCGRQAQTASRTPRAIRVGRPGRSSDRVRCVVAPAGGHDERRPGVRPTYSMRSCAAGASSTPAARAVTPLAAVSGGKPWAGTMKAICWTFGAGRRMQSRPVEECRHLGTLRHRP